MAWSQAYVAGTSPAARSRHTATAIGNKLVVIGGGDDARVYNDVYILDTGKIYVIFLILVRYMLIRIRFSLFADLFSHDGVEQNSTPGSAPCGQMGSREL
jgi:hypothetical protein